MPPAAVQGRAGDRQNLQERAIRQRQGDPRSKDSDDALMIDKCIKQMGWQMVFPGISFYNSHI